jgi:hypothetical protein
MDGICVAARFMVCLLSKRLSYWPIASARRICFDRFMVGPSAEVPLFQDRLGEVSRAGRPLGSSADRFCRLENVYLLIGLTAIDVVTHKPVSVSSVRQTARSPVPSQAVPIPPPAPGMCNAINGLLPRLFLIRCYFS